jgi:hypothetical protein
MFTYILIAAAAVLVVAAVWHQVRTWNKPGRQITQNAPMDDSMNARAKFQHDVNRNSGTRDGGFGY